MGPDVTYVIRSPLKTDALLPSLRRAAQRIDPDLPLNDIRTQQQQIDASMWQERMFASLMAGFGMLALALACVGIYIEPWRTRCLSERRACGVREKGPFSMVFPQQNDPPEI